MERKLRHHIIEALVIVALVAIFGPMLFMPASKQNYIQPATPPAFPDKASYDASLVPQKVSADPLAAQKSPLAIKTPEAFVIQMGSFTEEANLKRLLSQLRAEHLRVFTYKHEEKTGSVTRVYVGPQMRREDADLQLAKIESHLEVTGIVINFNPLEL